MKASVAPIMRATSISAACAMTCRRMVLKVTATSPAAKMPASIHSASLASRRKASKRLTQAESSCTCATLGQPAISLRRISSASGSLLVGSTMKASGSGLRGRLATISAMPSLACMRFSASSFGTKRHLPVAACTQPVLDFADLLLAGVEVHEQADLLHAGYVAAEIAQIVEQHVAESRAGSARCR